MPLKNHFPRAEMTDQRIVAPGSGRLDGVPADFRRDAAQRPGTEATRDELGAEADAEHGHPELDGRMNRIAFDGEMRIAVGLIRRMRSTENDEAMVTAERRPCLGLPVEIHVPDAKARGAKLLIEGAERLVGYVLKNEQLAHGVASLAKVTERFF
jgi:hypothetical protein